MATKDITDFQVCTAYALAEKLRRPDPATQPGHWPYGGLCNADKVVWPTEVLRDLTKQPEKVCFRAMERAYARGLIDYGVSLRAGWLTESGKALLKCTDTSASS